MEPGVPQDANTGWIMRELERRHLVRPSRPNERLDYDILMGLPYLDAVCRETLRVYPPVASVSREYAFLLTNPFKNAHRFNSL